MRTMIKADPIDRDLQVIFDSFMSPAAQARSLQSFAREALFEGQQQNKRVLGFLPNHTTSVDGRMGARIDDAKADSTIIFEFELVFDVVDWIRQELIVRSPVGRSDDSRPGHPGLYRRSHILLADNVEVPEGAPIPTQVFELAFVNTQPYARKIEKPRAQSQQAPNGVYQEVAKEAARRFGNIARIKFSYRSLVGISDLEEWASGTKLVRMGKRGPRTMTRDQRSEWLRRQPAVVIIVKG
jgi:hypothetical protein